MRLNRFQLALFKRIASQEEVTPKELAEALKESLFKISKNLRTLKKHGLVYKSGRKIVLSSSGVAPILGRFLLEHPQVENILANSGLLILQLLDTEQNLEDLSIKSGLSKPAIYRYLRQFLTRGLIIDKDGKYIINTQLWPDLRELIRSANLQLPERDPRIPLTAKIYYQTTARTVFSTPIKVDATPTAFSKYSDYDIPILEQEHFYRLPKKRLLLSEIFVDSLECLTTVRRKIVCALFFLKYRKRLQKITHPELEKIKKVLDGEPVLGYPSISEINERARLYDIRLPTN